MKIFIIGPGGVGKSTAGKILAKKLEYDLIDLDQEYCKRIQNIGIFIHVYGYEKYCYKNSELFYQLLEEKDKKKNIVFILSSGFLAHEGFNNLIKKHRQTIQEKGLSLLLLPSKSLEESTTIVVKRQMKRGLNLDLASEKQKFIERFSIYKQFGDIQIFSYQNPKIIALEMFNKIKTYDL
ncbi:shikimate kinase [bacterium]|jgi:shikimate kinase|nr:shikimate kinase [bacterium]MBT4649273.1 shikimate kinase [bacterium]